MAARWSKQHWEEVYKTKSSQTVSWYQAHATISQALIERIGLGRDAAIIDVGGGASTLVDDLLRQGYTRLTVLDISSAALAVARQRLGRSADAVHWIEGDITGVTLPRAAYELWHDRAVFHFLTEPTDRQAYVTQLERALRPGGHVIIATFGPEGPTRCSGLAVVRYAPESLQAELGGEFTLLDSQAEDHLTPGGIVQKFIYCHFARPRPNPSPP
jgi:ubiquinone/menaquinone biosynthesis C-methylase UbiE